MSVRTLSARAADSPFRATCSRTYIIPVQECAITPLLKREWTATSPAFQRLLTWLDEGVDSGGETYLQIRRRLALYFQRKRCLAPDDLADETLNRVMRRLEEEGGITDVSPAHYCYIVAKFVLLEHLREPERRARDLDANTQTQIPIATLGEAAAKEKVLDCLDRCLTALPEDESALILEYYRHEQGARIERRRELAARLRLTANALMIRASRIRDKLERCVAACRSAAEDRFQPPRSRR